MNDIERYRKRREKRLRKRMDEFKESDHPRGENGQFISGGMSVGLAEKIKNASSWVEKGELFKNNEPENNGGASEEAVSAVKEMFRRLGEAPVLTVAEVPSGDSKLKKEIEAVAKENGIHILDWKTKKKKSSKLLGYSPVQGGGAKTETSERKVWEIKVEPMKGDK